MDIKVLYDQKWHRFLRKIWLFKYIPFIDIVFASGSLVLGNMNKNSDFDVLVGARRGRLYTARFFCLTFFKLMGLRNNIKKEKVGFCFNHFVTPQSFCLAAPRCDYDTRLYKKLTPVFGSWRLARDFYQANGDWLDILEGSFPKVDDLRCRQVVEGDLSNIRKLFEKMLSGKLGSLTENILKRIQLFKIKRNLKVYANGDSRICCNDDEVRLWFYPKGVI